MNKEHPKIGHAGDTFSGSGHVIKVIAVRDDWFSVHVKTEQGRLSVSGTCSMPLANGVFIRFSGDVRIHPKYGESVACKQPLLIDLENTMRNESGIVSYLASGAIHGVGETIAKKIVTHFGLKTLDVIRSDAKEIKRMASKDLLGNTRVDSSQVSLALAETPGVSNKKAVQIIESWIAHEKTADIMIELMSCGATPNLANRILTYYNEKGMNLHDVLEENPWSIVRDIERVGFMTIDSIALRRGFSPLDVNRGVAAINAAIDDHAANGHTVCANSILKDGILSLVRMSKNETNYAWVDEAIHRAHRDGGIILQEIHPSSSRDPIWSGHRYARKERDIAQNLSRLMSFNADKIDTRQGLDLLERRGVFVDPSQLAAVEKALSTSVSVLTGGPGTGKTTMVQLILHSLPQSTQVILCSPTGKAAKRLKEATGVDAKTIHRTLGLDPETGRFIHHAKNKLLADIVIVDESTMTDVSLANSLLQAIPTTCRLVLVGDKDQLPSVGAGAFFRDVLRSERIAFGELTKIFRQGKGSGIPVLAQWINRAKDIRKDTALSSILDGLHIKYGSNASHSADIILLESKNNQEIVKMAVDFYEKNKNVRILSPMVKGDAGSLVINQEIKKRVNPSFVEGRPFSLGDPVIQLKNNYENKVFNGDIGVVISEGKDGVKVAFDEDNEVSYPYKTNELALAYAMSVHKSQGSEEACVAIIASPSHKHMMDKNLLYTGVTRGKGKVCIIGDTESFVEGCQKTPAGLRQTILEYTIRDEIPFNPLQQSRPSHHGVS